MLPFLHHLKKEIKKEIRTQVFRQNLDSNEMVKFKNRDLKKARWKEDEEFVLKGYYYDVISVKIINGEKIYYCFKDKKETNIAKIETKIKAIFSIKFRRPEIKSSFAKTYKLNLISKKNSDFLLDFKGIFFANSNSQHYQFSIKFSDFIEKPSIPPEV